MILMLFENIKCETSSYSENEDVIEVEFQFQKQRLSPKKNLNNYQYQYILCQNLLENISETERLLNDKYK